MKKTAITIGLAVAFIATPAVAQARPVQDSDVYCGPGRVEYVYDVRTGGLRGVCSDYVPKPLYPERANYWWNPWTW